MSARKSTLVMVGLVLFMVSLAYATAMRDTAWKVRGRVIDADTGQPIKDAMVTVSSNVIVTDENGAFSVESRGDTIGFRAHGYGRNTLPVSESDQFQEVRLKPVKPKAVYLTSYGIGDRSLRGNALRLISETELNALVIDVKGDRGMMMHKSEIPLAAQIGAQKLIIMKDMRGLIAGLKEQGIYTIARIVVFKDNLLGEARPDLAIKTAQGQLWRDREGLVWVDASKKEVWDYNIAIAEEAARLGFDEIQFDYVRFPDVKGPVFGVENTETNRVQAISGFLQEARKRLVPYNVFLSADIFGYVAWNLNDTFIGQRLDRMAASVDYLALMLYPSGFQFGIPGYTNPVEHPAEIISLSLERARQRTGIPAVRFRPWLQGFRDYAFDKRNFAGPEIRAQIAATESFGAGGWMLWNPRNVYLAEGLNTETGNKIEMAKLGPQGYTDSVQPAQVSSAGTGRKAELSNFPGGRVAPWPVEFQSYAFAGPSFFDRPGKHVPVSAAGGMHGNARYLHLSQAPSGNKPTEIMISKREILGHINFAERTTRAISRKSDLTKQPSGPVDIHFSPFLEAAGNYASEKHVVDAKKKGQVDRTSLPQLEGWMPWNVKDVNFVPTPNKHKRNVIVLSYR